MVVGLDRRVPHRGLHDPLRVPHVLRRVPRPRPPARVAERRSPVPLDRARGVQRSSPASLNAAPFGVEKFAEYVEPHVSRSRELVHPDFDYAAAAISFARRGRSASASRRSSGSTARSCRRSRASPSATGSRTPGYTFLVNKYYLDAPVRERHRRRRSRARSPGPSYWVNQHVIDARRQRRRAAAPRSLGRVHLRRRRPEGASTARSTASPTRPTRPVACCATCSRAACSGTRSSCSPRSGSSASPSLISPTSDSRGIVRR